MGTHRHWRGSVTNPSKKYIRVRFEADVIGEVIALATDYTYKIALLPKTTAYGPDGLTWMDATYELSGGLHYMIALLGTGQTIDPTANADVYCKATSVTKAETPVVWQASGDVEVI